MTRHTSIYLPGIGTVLADNHKGTLQPSTHVVGQRIGASYSADTTSGAARQREHRESFERMASRKVGEPSDGWIWLDHDGHPART